MHFNASWGIGAVEDKKLGFFAKHNLVVGAEVKNAHVPLSCSFGLKYDGGQHVRKELKYSILKLNRNAQ